MSLLNLRFIEGQEPFLGLLYLYSRKLLNPEENPFNVLIVLLCTISFTDVKAKRKYSLIDVKTDR
jgi:hypothetical protein